MHQTYQVYRELGQWLDYLAKQNIFIRIFNITVIYYINTF